MVPLGARVGAARAGAPHRLPHTPPPTPDHQTIPANILTHIFHQILLHKVPYFVVIREQFYVFRVRGPNVGLVECERLC